MGKLVLYLVTICFSYTCSLGATERATWVSKNYDKKFPTGLIVPKNWEKRVTFSSAIKRAQVLPSHFDWREQGTISPIENQGNCGSCWAFSATRTFQDVSSLIGEPINLSEQYLVSCNREGWGCGGGWWAHDYHMSPKGGVDESDFPYVAQDVQCKAGLNFKYQLASWSYLSAGQNGIPSVEEIKAAIYNYGTISVAVAVDSAFQSYSSGIFNTCNYTNINHAVNLIGWDDAGQYWIMANSWSPNWGENGFMRIKWGCNKIGYSANYVKYKKSPQPNPGPDPTPNPTPDPTPSPQPPPPPPPCAPFVDAGPDITARRGSTIVIGMPAKPGVSYQWFKDRTALDGWNTSRLSVRLSQTPGMRLLELQGSDNCGTDSDKLRIFVR